MLIGFKLEQNQREKVTFECLRRQEKYHLNVTLSQKVTFECLRRQGTPGQLAASDEYPALAEGCLESFCPFPNQLLVKG